MNLKKEVSVAKIAKDAEDLFRGGFFCSEAVVSSIRSNFEMDVPEEVIAMASGFPIGIGRSKCLCGAVSGGVMAIALYYGGENGYDERDAVLAHLETLDQRRFTVLSCRWANRRGDPPMPVFVWKEG